ncbi:DUF2786 domain-containing protein [Rhodococcus sp. X156]|uniref:DUF2786 domain-containing protein n=1 Tax=Rhodococcus sp. X156 TaxID=2499145 RepID=UPI000FD9292B|nr:DUF2786 domain-containing protein [Rhodococcus sp. X156]
MGSSSKKRPGAQRTSRLAPEPAADASVAELLHAAAALVGGTRTETRRLDGYVQRLARLDAEAEGAWPVLQPVLETLWDHGWQPADVAHVVRRDWPATVVDLAVGLVAGDVRARPDLPEEWSVQLHTIGAETAAADTAAWSRRHLLSPTEAWYDVACLLHRLTTLPTLQVLSPPPSQWSTGPVLTPVAGSGGAGEPKMLARIRALLAKAESTDYPEEAEALSAKAQDLMTRYAIDVAVLRAGAGSGVLGQVRARRVHVETPYPDGKAQLLSVVAEANGARLIWAESLGVATLVGLPEDLDLVELLFTSLLLQATRAMTEPGQGSENRSRSFRRAFLIAYAVRVGELLERSSRHAQDEAAQAYGAELVPVLRERGEAVAEVFTQLFPDVVVRRSRPVDAQGWHAGRAAADSADLGANRTRLAQ